MTQTTLFPDLVGPDDTDELRTAEISPDDLYRYRLTRTWGDPARILTWIMLNPSTADALDDDPTIRKCRGFTKRLGDYGGFEVVNLYAWRATKPRDMFTAAAAGADINGGRRNDTVLRDALSAAARRDMPVIAAWGAHARPDRVTWLTSQAHADRLHALHVTNAGAPGHPLMLGYDCAPAPWPGGDA